MAESILLEERPQAETIDINQYPPFELNAPSAALAGYDTQFPVTTADVYAQIHSLPLNPIENSVYDRAAGGAVIAAQLEGRALDPAEITAAAERALDNFRANAAANPTSLSAVLPQEFMIDMDNRLHTGSQLSTDFEWTDPETGVTTVETLEEVAAKNEAYAQAREAAAQARGHVAEAFSQGAADARFAAAVGSPVVGELPHYVDEHNYDFKYADAEGNELKFTQDVPSVDAPTTETPAVRQGPRPRPDGRFRTDRPDLYRVMPDGTLVREGAANDEEPTVQLRTPDNHRAPEDDNNPYKDIEQWPDSDEEPTAVMPTATEAAKEEELTEVIPTPVAQKEQEAAAESAKQPDKRKLRHRIRDARGKVREWLRGDLVQLPAAEYMPGYGPRVANEENGLVESNSHGDVVDAGYVQLPYGGVGKGSKRLGTGYAGLRKEHSDLPVQPTVALTPEQRDAVVRDEIRDSVFNNAILHSQVLYTDVLPRVRPRQGESVEAYNARVEAEVKRAKDQMYFNETMRRGVALRRPATTLGTAGEDQWRTNQYIYQYPEDPNNTYRAESYPETLPRPQQHRRPIFRRNRRR